MRRQIVLQVTLSSPATTAFGRVKTEILAISREARSQMKILDDANAELCRHRDLALTAYAQRLLARGADIDGEEFRGKLSKYAGELEAWRSKAMDGLRQFVQARMERPSTTLH